MSKYQQRFCYSTTAIIELNTKNLKVQFTKKIALESIIFRFLKLCKIRKVFETPMIDYIWLAKRGKNLHILFPRKQKTIGVI